MRLSCHAVIAVAVLLHRLEAKINDGQPEQAEPKQKGANEKPTIPSHVISFETETVQGEYIVSYDGYYTPNARKNLVKECLGRVNDLEWTMTPKPLLVAFRPSDFDVVKMSGNVLAAKSALEHTPQIRKVTEQRKITRRLTVALENEISKPEEEDSGYVGGGVGSPRILSAMKPAGNGSSQGAPVPAGLPSETRIGGGGGGSSRKLLRAAASSRQITALTKANVLWNQGFKGQGVKVAIFDTGLPKKHNHLKNVKERTNWTNEKAGHDGLGHGTFVAGVISGTNADCLGLAPDAELHIFRVFTDKQVSYTSWFLDAFNYVIMKKLNVLNLSIGGPDFMDQPFVDKVWELTANNIIMISAIGNDGPLYGTLNNPADQMDVIGVGGINFDDQIARFSSRGMTTWELPNGYGRMKPDLVTYGSHVLGSSLSGGCRTLSGTSVASPVITGAVALLASAMENKGLINPAVMKQALTSGAQRLSQYSMFEQGHGKLDLVRSLEFITNYIPHASLSPSYVDLTDCPYMWPYCTQGLYYTGMPVIVNVTLLNGMAASGQIVGEPTWHPYLQDRGDLLRLNFSFKREFWPWASYLAITLSVGPRGTSYNGVVKGYVSVNVQSKVAKDGHVKQPDDAKMDESVDEVVTSTLLLPIKARIIPTPPREKRILWDQFHNLRYPPGYFPRDNLRMKLDPLDWNGDHIHTNFKDLYVHLRRAGYFVEVLGYPITCFDASLYSTLMIVDPEEEFYPTERDKLAEDVQGHGLNLLLFGEWYNASVMSKLRFFDENTRHWWYPETGGANIPAINSLLRTWNISLSDRVFEGEVTVNGHSAHYTSGSSIVNFPKGGYVLTQTLLDQGEDVLRRVSPQPRVPNVAILGLYHSSTNSPSFASITDGEIDQNRVDHPSSLSSSLLQHSRSMLPRSVSENSDAAGQLKHSGSIGVFGDSNCIDSAHMKSDCFWLIDELLGAMRTKTEPSALFDSSDHWMSTDEWQRRFGLELSSSVPERPKEENNQFGKYSKVVNGYDEQGYPVFKSVPECPQFIWSKGVPANPSDEISRVINRIWTEAKAVKDATVSDWTLDQFGRKPGREGPGLLLTRRHSDDPIDNGEYNDDENSMMMHASAALNRMSDVYNYILETIRRGVRVLVSLFMSYGLLSLPLLALLITFAALLLFIYRFWCRRRFSTKRYHRFINRKSTLVSSVRPTATGSVTGTKRSI